MKAKQRFDYSTPVLCLMCGQLTSVLYAGSKEAAQEGRGLCENCHKLAEAGQHPLQTHTTWPQEDKAKA